jgi:hypothetical protein
VLEQDLKRSLAKLSIESVLEPLLRLELQERLMIVRNSFLNKLAGKDYFVFENSFSLQLIELISMIMPLSEQELFDNELIKPLQPLNREYIKKFAFAFVVECQ